MSERKGGGKTQGETVDILPQPLQLPKQHTVHSEHTYSLFLFLPCVLRTESSTLCFQLIWPLPVSTICLMTLVLTCGEPRWSTVIIVKQSEMMELLQLDTAKSNNNSQ